MGQASLGQDYFARVYAESDDPWSFATSAYEAEKYRATIAALGTRRYHAGFEIGCSVGVLTATWCKEKTSAQATVWPTSASNA